jgi:hypothetical protein
MCTWDPNGVSVVHMPVPFLLVPVDPPSHPWLLWTVGYAPGIIWMSNIHRTVSWLPFPEGSQTRLRYLTWVDSLDPAVPWSLKGTPSGFSQGGWQVLTQRAVRRDDVGQSFFE